MIMNIASGVRRSDAAAGARQQHANCGDDREAFIQTGYQQPITPG